MRVEVSECEDRDEWSTFVDQSIYPTVFHNWGWLKLVEKHTGSEFHPLVGNVGSNHMGLLPLFSMKKNGLRMLFSPPTRTGLPYLGPLFIQYDKDMKLQKIESSFLAFTDAVDNYIKEKLKPNYMMLAQVPGYADARPLIWNHYKVTPEYTYILDISGGEDAVFQNYQKQVRADIKKTEREGVTVKEGGRRELELVHDNLVERFVEQGLQTNISMEYLLDLYDACHPTNLRVFAAEYQGEFVGGFICIIHKDRASYWVGGSKTGLKGIYPNDLLQFEAMKWACKQGIKHYEIVGAVDPRLRHFKSKFNPELVLWFKAEKYSPALLKYVENPARFVFKKLGRGGLS